MNIEDLQSILAFSTTDKKQKVRIHAKYGDGTQEHCDICSFDAYSDAITLNIETTFGEEKHWKPTNEQMDVLGKLEETLVLERERNQENAHMYMVLKSLKEDLYKLRK